ncbi:MAG: Holliday junction resolvase RuvX [Chloracidobacterium sp.]|nr:Holliday junction resolvase RuvX [Chloracidobacterium sp.]
MQELDTVNNVPIADISQVPPAGRLLSLDPGTKRIGVAICDELRVTTRPLDVITRTNWKSLLLSVKTIIAEFDAKALAIGLPLESDGTESEMSTYARDLARKFALSLDIPVVLQDERNTSYEAKSRLWSEGAAADTRAKVDSAAAAIILADLIDRLPPKPSNEPISSTK